MRSRGLAVALLLAALGPGTATAGITVKDDDGRTVTLASSARRIVTLAPFLTEMVYEVGAGSRLVAVSEHSDWPEAARSLPQVGNAFDFSLERIAALRPDLVLVWQDSVRASDIERLEGFGARVAVIRARTLADVPRALRVVAMLAGGDAAPATRAYEAKLGELRERHAASRTLSVLLEIWHQPLTTISGRHFMNEALAVCGARNAFADLPGVAPVVPWEEVYRRDPDAIVGVSEGVRPADFMAAWRERRELRAVKSNRLVLVPPDRLERPSARLAEGVADLCDALDRVR